MLKTSECVSPLHPDKICDRISDAIVDYFLTKDPNARAAIEVMGGHGKLKIFGEASAKCEWPSDAQFTSIIRSIIPKHLSGNIEIETLIFQQSPEIAGGVDSGGAGDQGIVVGYACRENDLRIPQEHYLARKLCQFIYKIHPDDGKTQITINENNKIQTIVASWRGVARVELEEIVRQWLRDFYGPNENISPEILCNPAGDWDQGGFDSDTGLTGRKIVCDAYGPRVPVGGGAFSGKDATKVDRSGAYAARRLALKLLKSDKQNIEVTIRAAFVIGKLEPVQVMAEILRQIDDRQAMTELDMTKDFAKFFKPGVMIKRFNLRDPIFEKTAEWGSFGNPAFAWEKI